MTMPTKCTEIRGEFPLYVGRELESPTVERVELHLEQCASCRQALGQAQAAREALLDHFENGTEFRVRHSIWPQVREALRDEGLIAPADSTAFASASIANGRPSAAGKPSRWGGIYRLTGLAAAAALLFLLGSVAGHLAFDSETAPISGEGPVSGNGMLGPGGDGVPTAHVEPPTSELLRPVAGRAVSPVLAGEQSMEKGAEVLHGLPVGESLRPRIPMNWSRGNQPAAYTTSETRHPDGVH